MPAQLVDHQSGQRFAVDVLGDNDHVLLASLQQLLQGGDQVGNGGNLLVGDDEVGIFDDGFHAVGVGDEVRRGVAAVDLHSLDVLNLVGKSAGLFHGNDAVLANFLHGLGDGLADGVFMGGKGGNLPDALARLHGLGHALQFGDHATHGGLDATLDGHGVGAGGHVLEAFVDDGLGQHDAGGGAVAGGVVGLGGGFLQKLGAHVLKNVGQLDLLGDGHAVGADLRGSELLVQHDVAAAGAQGNLDRVGQDVDSGAQRLAGVFSVCHLLCGHWGLLVGVCAIRDVFVYVREFRSWNGTASPVWPGRLIHA